MSSPEPTASVTPSEVGGDESVSVGVGLLRIEAHADGTGTTRVVLVFDGDLPNGAVRRLDDVTKPSPSTAGYGTQTSNDLAGGISVCGSTHSFPPPGNRTVDIFLPNAWFESEMVGDVPIVSDPGSATPSKIVICEPLQGVVQVSVWGAASGRIDDVGVSVDANTVRVDIAPDPTDRQIADGHSCEPGPSPSAGVDQSVPADRRGEALVKHLTGIDELVLQDEQEGIEIKYDDPNYGGVWGDRQGGWVVAVLDCSLVDPDRIAQIAGGPEAVRLIEVRYGFEEVNQFQDRLIAELRSAAMVGDVWIDSTLTGRTIRVVVEDPSRLDSDFGASVPPNVFVVETRMSRLLLKFGGDPDLVQAAA